MVDFVNEFVTNARTDADLRAPESTYEFDATPAPMETEFGDPITEAF